MKDLKVSIKNPCTFSDDTMYAVGNNCDFCTVCATKVYDFTNATEEEFLEVYNKNNGNICSQAKVDEKGNFIFLESKTPQSRWKAWAFSLLAFLGISVTNTSCAPDKTIVGKMEVTNEVKDTVDLPIKQEVKGKPKVREEKKDTQKVEKTDRIKKGKTSKK